MRVFSHYCKGISGIDSAADALEMELEEFHDFVKDAKIETRLIRFDAMTSSSPRPTRPTRRRPSSSGKRERRNAVVQAGHRGARSAGQAQEPHARAQAPTGPARVRRASSRRRRGALQAASTTG